MSSGAIQPSVLRYLRAQVASGVHAVQLFDSWVGCLGAADYTQYVAPSTRAIVEALRPAGAPIIHFGTGTAGLLPEMAAAGGEVIGVDWRVSLAQAWARIGHDRGIQGNLDPAVLLAPREVVRQRTLEILCDADGRPGHIFNLGHGVLPQTPRDQLRYVVDLVHEYTDRGAEASR